MSLELSKNIEEGANKEAKDANKEVKDGPALFYNDIESDEKKTNNEELKKRVRFTEDSKKYCGLLPDTDILDTVVDGYFNIQCIRSSKDIQIFLKDRFDSNYLNPSILQKVISGINSLIEKLQSVDVGVNVPVLLKGGSKKGNQLQKIHLPFLQKFKCLFERFMVLEGVSL